ncbi:MAG: hypothetical protein NC548_33935 [Lachnospiraceae bacterium]|nr:hypothetical protein [Lachnospiraceae bacterium]
MAEEYIKDGFKIKIGRRRTHITTYENMVLQITQPVKKDKPKKIKKSVPSNYADCNYRNRMKKRRREVREICWNNFDLPYVVMLTLTFDQNSQKEKNFTHIETAHHEFKKFIQRVNSHYQDFRYISTFSRQNNGNWHYHIMCNFQHSIANNEIKNLWKNGITYISYIKTTEDYNRAIQYLTDNMNESADALKGKHGYMCSRSVERDIELVSWREEQFNDFLEAFEKVKENKRTILYECKNPLGIKGTYTDEETGETFEVHLLNQELDPMLEQAGYKKWETIYTHLTSKADFSDRFKPLQPATLRPKKFKRTKLEN